MCSNNFLLTGKLIRYYITYLSKQKRNAVNNNKKHLSIGSDILISYESVLVKLGFRYICPPCRIIRHRVEKILLTLYVRILWQRNLFQNIRQIVGFTLILYVPDVVYFACLCLPHQHGFLPTTPRVTKIFAYGNPKRPIPTTSRVGMDRLSITPTRSLRRYAIFMHYAIFNKIESSRREDALTQLRDYSRKVSFPKTQQCIVQFRNRTENLEMTILIILRLSTYTLIH